MSSIQEKAKAFGKNVEKWAKGTIERGEPLGQISFHNKPDLQQDLPTIYIKIHDPALRTVRKRKGKKDQINFTPRVVQDRAMRTKDGATVLRFMIRNYNITPDAFEKAMQQEALWQKTQDEIKREHDLEEQARQKERDRFPNKFLRLSRYLHVRDYEKKLAEAAKTATLEDLQEALTRLPLERLDLSETQKTTALTWLQIQMDQKRHA